jgi:hypothetical protein
MTNDPANGDVVRQSHQNPYKDFPIWPQIHK